MTDTKKYSDERKKLLKILKILSKEQVTLSDGNEEMVLPKEVVNSFRKKTFDKIDFLDEVFDSSIAEERKNFKDFLDAI